MPMVERQYWALDRARHPLYDPYQAKFPRAMPLLGLPAASISVKSIFKKEMIQNVWLTEMIVRYISYDTKSL